MEMTDGTNIARAFSLIPLAWALGAIIGCVPECVYLGM